MPDVGVLNLQIRDDSNEAAGGLDQLVSKLKSLSKIASTKNEGLGNVAQHIRDIVDATKIDNAKVTASMKSITTLMNSFSGLTKLNSIGKLNVKPIKDLKAAIGSGFNIGMAGTQLKNIRDALSGDWNEGNATIARDSMKAVATGAQSLGKTKAASVIRSVADALNEYNSALSAQKAVEAGTMEALGRYTGEPNSTGRIPLNLQQFGGRGSKSSAGQMQMDLDSLMKWSEGFTAIQSTVESAKEPVAALGEAMNDVSSAAQSTQLNEYLVDPITQLMERFRNCEAAAGTFGNSISSSSYSTNLMSADAITAARNIELLTDRLNKPIKYKGFGDVVEQLNGIGRGFLSAKEAAEVFEKTPMQDMRIELQETGDVLQSAVINRFQEMYGMFGEMAHNFGWFKKETLRLMEGPDIHRPVAAENMLSTYVEGWKPDWIFGEGTVSEAEEVKNQLLGISEEALRLNAEMHQKYAAYNERTLEDFYNGIHWGRDKEGNAFQYQQSDLMSRWLHGEGSVKEQTYAIDEMAERFGMTVDEVRQRISQLKAESGSAASAVEKLASAMNEGAGGNPLARAYGEEMVENLVSQYSKIDLMELKLGGMKQALADDINMNRVDTQQIAERTARIQDMIAAIDKLKNAQTVSSNVIGKMRAGWDAFKKSIKSVFPTLTGMVKRFGQIAKYRFLRTILKQITSGAQEGLENVYRYSQMVGTSFAPAMDSAASALAQMRNSIGAALAPALQAIIPLLNNIVSAFVNVINVANQFFAILGGQGSWTRAKPYAAKAFDDIKESAKGAGGAAKDLLADWDELNIIQSNSGGGGGGGSGTDIADFESMFEEVGIFDENIRKVATFLKDNFEEILATVIAIKSAIFAWKLSGALASSLPILSKIAGGFSAAATIGITLMLTDLTGKAFASTGDVGWLIADGLTGAIGSTLARKIATKIAGGGIGWATQGFTLILAGSVNVKNAVEAANDGADAEAWALGALGSIEAGIGAALVAKGLLAASTGFAFGAGMITAGITLGLTAYLIVDAKRKATYKKMAYDAFQKAGAGGIDPSTYIKALQEELDKRTANAKLVVDASLGLDENGEKFASALSSLAALNAVITSDGLSTEDATKFKEAWDVVIDSLGKISKISYETIFAGLDEAIAHGTEEIRNAAKEYRTEILKAENIMNGLRGRLETELDFLQREILAGTDDPKVFERYEQIYNELANSTQSGLKDVTDAIEKGARFDFSHGENPIEEASQFISDGLNGTIQTGIDQVKAQYDAELEALNNVRNELETYKRLGIVDENSETYKRLVKLYDGLEETYKKNLENQLKELAGLKQGAYDTISRQAIEGYLSLDPTDENALKSYVENVFKPLKKAIEEAGGEVPEEVEAYIARNGQTLGDAIEMARATSRSAIYKSLFDDALYGNIEDGMTAAIGYEIDLVGGDTSKISEEARKEIISTLYDVFGDPEKIIEQFIRTKENGGAFEWSIEDIIGGFDLEGMDVDELNELLEAIQRVRNGIEEKLYGDAHRNPQDQEYLEWYEYQERMGEVATTYDALKKKVQDAIDAKNVREEEIRKKTSSVASAFEDMASRIKSAIGSLNGAGFSFSSIGLRGVINVNAIEKRASGGFVKSGDLVMANENGNFEMMGRMGNQPVVANNQQIVSGISQGVASANEGVEARLGSIETLLTRVLQKEFIAKATPSSGWGAMNERSGVAYDRVRG